MNRSKKSFIIWMLLVTLFCCSGGSMLNSVQALKNQGKVMMSSATAQGRGKRKTKMFVLDEEDHFFNRCCAVVDIWFDWMGFHTLPQTIRYAIVLFVMVAPCQAAFFFYCCVHNDEYEDEEEEAQFKQRAAKWEARR